MAVTNDRTIQAAPELKRGLSLIQATAINMIDMVGIGPFITVSGIVLLLQGPMSMLAWGLGALLSIMDGMVWAELGAKWPQAGGSYVFLQKLFGKRGRLMAFLFVWQTSIQAPLVMASAAIGFAAYFRYLYPLSVWEGKALSGSLIILMIILLYRNIQSIGRLSVVLWMITGGTLIWILISAGLPAKPASAFGWLGQIKPDSAFAFVLGAATQKAVYSYLGYYNVCHLGGEIKSPERNIPRAIFISIVGIAVLYMGMQAAVLHRLPWQAVGQSEFVMSLYFQEIYSPFVAKIATGLILIIALSSLFSVMLGYSRVPYAAAKDGLFFAPFARVHAKHHIPHVSLLAMGGLAFVFSLLFKMKDVIAAIIAMRILVQFVAQAVGVMAWHSRTGKAARPFNMPLYPLPAVLSIVIWLYIFLTTDWHFTALACGMIGMGLLVYWLVWGRQKEVQ